MRKYSYIFIILLIVSACKREEKIGHHKEADFFDLRAYVAQEVQRYQQSDCTVYKEGQIDVEDDAVQFDIDSLNIQKEFKILEDFQIKKSAWFDYFSIDTIQENIEGLGEVSTIWYQTHSSNIPIKSLKVSFPKDNFQKVIMIEGDRKVKNWIFHTEQKVYYTGSALRVEGYQKVLWFTATNFNITTIYNCQNESN